MIHERELQAGGILEDSADIAIIRALTVHGRVLANGADVSGHRHFGTAAVCGSVKPIPLRYIAPAEPLVYSCGELVSPTA